MAQLIAQRKPNQPFGMALFIVEGDSAAPTYEPLAFSPLAYLRSTLELGPNIRFGDLIEFVREHPELHPLLDRECYVSSFLSHIPPLNVLTPPLPAPDPEDDQPIAYLRLSHSVGLNITTRQFDAYFDVSGIYIDPLGATTPLGVSFTDPSTLLYTPLVLKTTTNISQDDWSSTDIPPPLCSDVNYPFTLFDFLYEFFWELSFHGDVIETQATFQGLKDTIEEIKNNPNLEYVVVDPEDLMSDSRLDSSPRLTGLNSPKL